MRGLALLHPSPSISSYTSCMMCDFSEFLEADRTYCIIKYTEQGGHVVLRPAGPRNGCPGGQPVLGRTTRPGEQFNGGGGTFGPMTPFLRL